MRAKLLSPYWMPVWFFAGGILVGTLLLELDISHPGKGLSWIDAFFTATSAMCVTGLVVVDTGTFFSPVGQWIILLLMQLGGLGIMTFATLILHLLGKHVSLSDRLAVGQSLLRDPTFNLGKFLARVVGGTLAIEFVGAMSLWFFDPVGFSPFSAVFHSVSAFCNGGFSLYSDSLSQWKGDVGVNVVVMTLIVLGGLGFFVLNECASLAKELILHWRERRRGGLVLTWHSSIVLKTSFFLIAIGAVVIFVAEGLGSSTPESLGDRILTALFQSVTCRTAGFNTVDIGSMTNISLAFMMLLMIIGGSPGSCAGGIKTTTFRALCSFVVSQFKGRYQVQIGRFALSQDSLNKALSLVIIAMLLILVGTMALTSLESAEVSYLMGREEFMVNLFEVVSAFGTVGLSTGLTAKLSGAEKMCISLLMFVGRIGPVWLLSALHSWQTERRYQLPSADLPLG